MSNPVRNAELRRIIHHPACLNRMKVRCKFSELETTWRAGPAEHVAVLTPPTPCLSRAYLVSFTLSAQWRLAHNGARAGEQPNSLIRDHETREEVPVHNVLYL
jgi:hypothetical protein